MLSGLVAEGRMGVKTMRGFWEWTSDTASEARRTYEEKLLAALKLLDVRSSVGNDGEKIA